MLYLQYNVVKGNKRNTDCIFYVFITSISSNKILQVPFVQVQRNLRILKLKGISDYRGIYCG